MPGSEVKPTESLKLRRLYIKMRLIELKSERDRLIQERDAIDGTLAAAKAVKLNGTSEILIPRT